MRVSIFAVALLSACGGSVAGYDGLLEPPERGVQLLSEPFVLDAGQERTRCYHLNMNNAEVLEVVRFQTNQRPGQHHFNIFMSDLEREDGFGPCPDEFELFVGARPIVDGSSGAVDYRFPDGMAFPLPANTLIIMQLHWINVTDAPAEQQFALNLYTADEPARTHVDLYGFTTLEITLPPNERTTIQKDCTIRDTIGLLSMSSHFHQRGVLATTQVIRDGRSEQVYSNDRWDDPEVEFFDDPIPVTNGDVVRFECTYDNADDFTVEYGPSASDEMCFVFGYYFPKKGLIPCF